MAKICQKCGSENLDFKVFCGFCGATLEDSPHEISTESDVKVLKDNSPQTPLPDTMTNSLGGSKTLGLTLLLTPLALTLLTIPLLWRLIEAEMASYELMFGIAIMVFVESIICVGVAVQSVEWRMGYLDGAARVLLVLLLFLSIAPFLIVGLTILIGNFPIEIAWLFALAILISIIWLFYFGWLRGIAYKWEKAT